ncbi:helix-turn-helix transcriptional regulator [Streptomyces sp. LP11]|uniref:Helix-turn-helix transcriptional regulator n=1 Tax=Streptomyces pyxinicus TaxID=2970331 RepID=A0ABT2B4Z4_9ACTN|nr:helix-turn-helix transcriptional regulator [Streptomyces sp. LP11]MCS0603500.1 helix-turn-helix transcriptional regulator [Streptomyces sp. LP11]
MGADAFADRASRELQATGAVSHRHGERLISQLTPQERIVAEKAATGATSRDVAAMLFLSPRTVDTHLRNVYRKLGISSRRELRGMSW